jgi:uncharacterized cupin superfamily protein
MNGPSINWDDLPPHHVTRGEIDADFRNLGAAAGSVRVGVRREDMPSGGRPTPAHRHSYEEEIFYVLGGSGLSWQDGTTCEIGPGDCLSYPPGRRAHTVIGGPDGLAVLAFGERPLTEVTVMPRSGTAWLGPTWADVGGDPHPWVRDEAAGPIPTPDPGERHGGIVNVDDVPPIEVDQGDSVFSRRPLTQAGGLVRTGLQHVRLEPGRLGFPPHCHSMQEEIFVVLEGEGTLLLYAAQPRPGASAWIPTPEPQEHPLRQGSVVARPAGTATAHAFRAGETGMTYLAYGTRDTGDVTWYPRSRKVVFQGHMLAARIEITDYWDGER